MCVSMCVCVRHLAFTGLGATLKAVFEIHSAPVTISLCQALVVNGGC